MKFIARPLLLLASLWGVRKIYSLAATLQDCILLMPVF
jgi:hypothetical protein